MSDPTDSRGSVASATDPIAASPVYPAGSRVNDAGHLEVAGCDVMDLVAEHGTPAYIYSEDDIRSRAAEYVRAFSERTGDRSSSTP
jgi:diaminopimelate decarboxylase